MRHSVIRIIVLLAWLPALACTTPNPTTPWRLSESSQVPVGPELAQDIFLALDAASQVGTSPSISKFQVRAATVVEQNGTKHVIIGGNTEYQVPEAIHAETSLLNHVANQLGPDATREVKFLAFYTDGECGTSLSCGDCRDYQIATTDFENLLVACGQGSDHTVRVRKFSDAVVAEESFPLVGAGQIPLSSDELESLVSAARAARSQGVRLFTDSQDHAGAAALSFQGNLYRAAGADDAAFHYRYPIGGVLQQAASQGDYFIKAILVAGEEGSWPRISYRERQYGYESSSFNQIQEKDPILLILVDGRGAYRLTTFEEALPYAFSTNSFMPQAVQEFLKQHSK